MTTHTDSIMSNILPMTRVKAPTSLNQIDPSPANIEKLFYASLKAVREGFSLKKWGFELPESM